MWCSGWHQETHSEKCIREYKMAVEVMNMMKREGKLDEVCKVKAIQVPLFMNVACIVWGNTELEYGYAKLKKKMPKGYIEVKV